MMIIDKDTAFEPGVHLIKEGIDIAADGITLSGPGTVLVGSGEGSGIHLNGRRGVTIRDLSIRSYRHGIEARGCEGLSIEGVHVTGTAETDHNTIFLNIFHEPGSYPGGILLRGVSESRITGCDLTHQMSGLLAYDCSSLTIKNNNASYSSGFGFYLSGTNKSRFEANYADFCCRWHVREEGGGHMGADAAGFVIVNGSSRNVFEKNFARLGGDGFFLAGLRHDLVFAPCNDNLFVENDASWSPNIAFEATFSAGNIFRHNLANKCNYGFWLGFSRDNVIEDNQVNQNHQAGIAVENGIRMSVRGNRFVSNARGILLWSKRIPQFDAAVPENDTSRDWEIVENDFVGNGAAVRIAADQDHGIRDYLDNGRCPPPRDHRLKDNRFDRNGKDIDANPSFLGE